MSKKSAHIDSVLALILATLVVGGGLLFTSAAFGLLARGSLNMSSVFLSHLGMGMGAGFVALLIGVFADYRLWRKYAPFLFGAALLITAAVFIPGIGFEHGGARRWIHVGGMSLQPSEMLKLAALLLGAAYFATIKQKVATTQWGLGGFLAILVVPALLLIAQPDIGTLGVIAISLFAIFWVAGARMRDIALLVVIGMIAFAAVFFTKPYIRDRISTFFDPSQGQHAESYQIRQSLIAIGSGQIVGRGFGQGIQKFTYLPEPMGDSIFAVAGEELGFVGTVSIVLLFLAFGLRGFHVATKAADPFGMYLAVGIATYLTIEAFINIASMLGMVPVTGIPLTFISQGGSAMLMTLASAGILLGISRGKKKAA
ncbi:MAG: stage sporulation protein cell division protein FtsW [Candidatus Parcubacteria bacterium]|jgi:cell division protein FtsW